MNKMVSSAKTKYFGKYRKHLEKIPDWIPGSWGIQYPVDVTIFEDRGQGYHIGHDKGARITTDKDSQLYILKHRDEALPAVNYEHIFPSEHGQEVFLYSPEKGIYNPITPGVDADKEEFDFSVEDIYWRMWNKLRDKEEQQILEQDEEHWLKRHQQAILYASAGIFFLLLFIGAGMYFDKSTINVVVEGGGEAASILLLSRLKNRWW